MSGINLPLDHMLLTEGLANVVRAIESDLARRIAYLDHMAEGRYQVGVGIGGLPIDHSRFADNSLMNIQFGA